MNSSSNILRSLALFVVLMLLQVLVFNDLRLSNLVNPYVYIAFIIALPFGTSHAMTMTLAFVAGIIIDIFANTPGMHAAACVLMGFMRPYILKFISLNTEYNADDMPSMGLYGITWFVKYTAMMTAVHHVFLFIIERFDAMYLPSTLIRIVLSTASTILFIVILQFFMPQRQHGR